jgi:hypothetical protein
MKVSQLTVALSGSRFGVDFNAVANRLRVVSDTGQKLRHTIDDKAAPLGTSVDGMLTNPTMPPSTAGRHHEPRPERRAATTLFDIDTMADRVALQSPANAGTLAPAGNLSVNAGPDAGFDIYFSPKHGTHQGFAALNTAGSSRLYEINVLTGPHPRPGRLLQEPSGHRPRPAPEPALTPPARRVCRCGRPRPVTRVVRAEGRRVTRGPSVGFVRFRFPVKDLSMKRIALGLSLACMTAALLVPTMGTASAAPAVAQASAFDRDRFDRGDCDRDRFDRKDFDHDRFDRKDFDHDRFDRRDFDDIRIGLIVL